VTPRSGRETLHATGEKRLVHLTTIYYEVMSLFLGTFKFSLTGGLTKYLGYDY
jgi:hypothetical protein